MEQTLVDELQVLLDRLAGRLGQSVAVDSPDGSLIAVSRHYGDEDPYRVDLLLRRRMSDEARAHFRPYISQAHTPGEPVHVPQNAALSIDARWCYAIGTGIAHLWIIDRGQAPASSVITSYCEHIAAILSHRSASQQDALPSTQYVRQITELLLRRARSDEPAAFPDDALPSGTFVVVSIPATPLAGEPSRGKNEAVLLALRRAASHRLIPITAVTDDDFDIVVLVADDVSDAGSAGSSAPDTDAITELREHTERQLHELGFAGTLGLAGPGPAAELRTLYARATVASVLGAELFARERIVPWNELETTATHVLARGSGPENPRVAALKTLLTDADSFAFSTIAAFMRASQGASPAALLHVHRTTVHYRVQQILQLTGIDLTLPPDRYLAFTEWLRIHCERTVPQDLLERVTQHP